MSPVIIIKITLLSGRYHAHPWGDVQHAMAGPEWPPSPWRLLRAIAACWFGAAEPPCSAAQRDDLIEKLGRCGAPTIWLPSTSFAELPFYHPVTLDKAEKLAPEEARASGKKTRPVREINSRVLHFDHFAVLAAPDIYFVFDIDLSKEERSLLAKILSIGRYFGRAESRASFFLAGNNVQRPDGYFETTPAQEDDRDGNTIRRSVLVTTANFKACDLWQVRQVAKAKGKAKSNVQAADDHPTHLVEALIDARKAVPDGTKWVHYKLPRSAVVHELPRKKAPVTRRRTRPAAEVLFRLFRRVPIPIVDTVSIARDFRDQVVRAYEATGHSAVLLSGREQDGSVSRGHRHAYYLPQPTHPGGFLERMVVRLPGGENGVEQEIIDALLSVTRLWRRDRYPVLVVAEDIRPEPMTPAAATIWRSLTPMLGPLHHRKGRNYTEPGQQLLNTLRSAVAIAPRLITAEVVPVLSHLYSGSKSGNSRHYRFTRRAGTRFTLEFPEPIQPPIALGADAHFGLGQFEPIIDGL